MFVPSCLSRSSKSSGGKDENLFIFNQAAQKEVGINGG
jgi:hypothetical protein